MAKIPQTQFVNAIQKLEDQMTRHDRTTDSIDFGKSWHIRVIETKDYDYYELHHYGTLIAKITREQGDDIILEYRNVTSGSDRDGINSLLHLLGADIKTNIHGDIIPTGGI